MSQFRRLVARLFDLLLPRHRNAILARTVTSGRLSALLRPSTLERAAWIHTLWPYWNAEVRACIKAVKYYGEKEVALRMGAIAADYITDYLSDESALGGMAAPVVVPIPSSPRRLRERGYSQAALFASVIATEVSLRYEPHALARAERVSQVHVPRSERKKNISDAFRVPHVELVEGRTILLIDDVVESGATLKDARRALLEAGAKRVIAIALAH
ncbi:MAG: phosphoribosyltransferase family protein [Patescibacteria group bacterium]